MPRPITVDSYAKSADGTLYRVVYVGGLQAQLAAVDGGEYIYLPLEELRRVSNPKDKRPRVEGVPEERPRCEWCARRLRPSVVNHYTGETESWKRTIVRRTFSGWQSYVGAFDTKDCAVAFAGAAFRAGYRRKPR